MAALDEAGFEKTHETPAVYRPWDDRPENRAIFVLYNSIFELPAGNYYLLGKSSLKRLSREGVDLMTHEGLQDALHSFELDPFYVGVVALDKEAKNALAGYRSIMMLGIRVYTYPFRSSVDDIADYVIERGVEKVYAVGEKVCYEVKLVGGENRDAVIKRLRKMPQLSRLDGMIAPLYPGLAQEMREEGYFEVSDVPPIFANWADSLRGYKNLTYVLGLTRFEPGQYLWLEADTYRVIDNVSMETGDWTTYKGLDDTLEAFFSKDDALGVVTDVEVIGRLLRNRGFELVRGDGVDVYMRPRKDQ
jgi:hypothetical protein